ncbi:MAG: hypothetical protein ACLQVN_01015 [Bryobacteraceae bacterium]
MLVALFFAAAVWGQAQSAPAAAGRAQVAGTVTSVNAGSGQLDLKTDTGAAVTVTTTDHSFIRRLPPGENDTKKALPIELKDVSAGDRAVAIGTASADRKAIEARTIYIMTRADVAQVHEKEQEDWQKRGTTGIVASIDLNASSFTIKTGGKTLTVQPSARTEYERYALESAKMSDAKPGTFDQIKIGDQVNVLGDKNADDTSIAAEKVVSGSFPQLAATIVSVNANTGILTVKDLAAKKNRFIRVTSDTTLRKLPPQLAAMLARRYQPGGQGGGGWGGSRGGRSGQPDMAGGPARGGRGGDLKQMLDRLPVVPLTELKAGDAIMVSTTEGTDSSHSTAIMLLAGVEPLLTASPSSTRDIMSGWNLGGGGEGGEGN